MVIIDEDARRWLSSMMITVRKCRGCVIMTVGDAEDARGWLSWVMITVMLTMMGDGYEEMHRMRSHRYHHAEDAR